MYVGFNERKQKLLELQHNAPIKWVRLLVMKVSNICVSIYFDLYKYMHMNI